MNQVILIASLTLYLWHEYYDNSCFELVCLFTDKKISGTAIVKPDVVPSIIVIIVLLDQFWRIFILVKQFEWFTFKDKLDKSRVFYPKEHARLMRSGFGRGHYFEMNRLRLNKGEYKMKNLEEFEKKLDAKEDRFNELQRSLGHQYCYGLEPSAVGYRRCVMHLVLE